MNSWSGKYKNNGIKSVNKYRVIFWLIHILNMIFAIGKYDMMCYFMAGDYWMICLDLLNKNKTAIVKKTSHPKVL